MMIKILRKLICALLCVVTLAGCSSKEKPKQYVAELSNPYLSTLPSSFNKRLDVSYIENLKKVHMLLSVMNLSRSD